MQIRSHKLTYRAPLRDFAFLLWEQFRVHSNPHLSAGVTREGVTALLRQIADYTEREMAPSYRESDEQEAHLDSQGTVCTPESFPALLEGYRRLANQLGFMSDDETRGTLEIVQHMVVEMMVGANPSFVTYVGFNRPALTLLETFGSKTLKAQFAPALRSLDSSACLCITEKSAGSDLNLLQACATLQDDGTYRLEGHKWLISAGMHELTDNICYFVLARTSGKASGMMGLSCFLVPRFRLDTAGRPTIDNGVRCREVVRKMGLKGCANTHLTFSEEVPTVAWLLGETQGHGLQQLMTMMTPARISTGIYALGLASAACEAAHDYASQRVQGKRFDQSMSGNAPSLPIEAHPDVRRMRLDMLAVTSGCRALIARLGLCQAELRSATGDPAARSVAQNLLDVLLPIVKAYTSDQAWRVTETAIQTFGGVGYLRDYPVEQQARDCKILSIWEGTNHMQSLFLVRDKLGLCLRPHKLQTVVDQVQQTLAFVRSLEIADVEAQLVNEAGDALMVCASAIGTAVRAGNMNRVPAVSCAFQAALGDYLIAWHLLEAAGISACALRDGGVAQDDRTFYGDKIDAARHFVRHRLALANAAFHTIARDLAEPWEPAASVHAHHEHAGA
ncbi:MULTISPECIES: acyl-CoA dehydrogenase [unclassified Paraburkholderia]|uniref:acyl-CoA dehydrogenase n=1 Tax=unclassified Paraburkholderia TaxID=2615204 RepID=UPI002AB19331|nr:MULTISPECIES: acyl-CoA dehydrogenase [unclassified Paraburkholderia]